MIYNFLCLEILLSNATEIINMPTEVTEFGFLKAV